MKVKKLILSLLVFCFTLSAHSQSLSAYQIIEKTHKNRDLQSFKSQGKMTILRPTWKRVVGIKTWVKTRDMTLVLITAPVKEKGLAFLKRGNNLWNWQPSIGRTIKISASASNQSWMGSDFTTDDILKYVSFIDDFTHKLLGKETFDGEICYKVQLTPKPNSRMVWGKIISWISTKDFVERRIEYYDDTGKLMRSCVMRNVKTFNGHKVPMLIEITPANKKGHKSILEITEYTLVASMQESFFSIQNIKRLH
ncbi:outer membrane lipoprotein-sorting protein [Prevotella sp. OH937_COT-195]|uniref:outer membrane lipoprotein-sorting protein n=1 Tax=Prevotella sp. OH937_COT-195 TaxID=2491051 RepID=UPI0013157CED|nr:outer membrane lipoprotein-sorting protein [Prevotella sp. OH937_COT-195]